MNILIAGGGSIGQRHIKNLQVLGDHSIWVLKRTQDPAFEKEFNVTVLNSYAAAEKLGLDAIFICTPTSLHNEGLEWGIKNNLHVFMEKPLIHSSEGIQKAEALLSGYTGTFFIGFMLRYHPLVRSIKTLLNEKTLGEVYAARFEFGSYLPYWHPWEDYRISYAARPELGGGVINTITHELDLIHYFFGKPESVVCEARNLNRLKIDVEEVCEAIFGYPEKTVSLHLNYLQKDYDRNIKIRCDEGEILWDWHDNQVIVKRHKEKPEAITIPKPFDVNGLYVEEVQHFLSLIQSRTVTHALDGKHAVSNTELMLKMHESSNTGQRIHT
jgi:predicted dehydrogenase